MTTSSGPQWVDFFYYHTRSSAYTLFTTWDKSILHQQVLTTTNDRPLAQVQSLWEHDYSLKQLTYVHNQWWVLGEQREYEEGKQRPQQNVIMDPKLPKDELQQACADGCRITYLDYTHGQWIVVSDKNPSGYEQSVHITSGEFPAKYIVEEVWEKSKFVSRCACADGTWVVIVIPEPGNYELHQGYLVTGDWPGEKILELLKEEKSIHTLKFDEKDRHWVAVWEHNPMVTHSISITHSYPLDKFVEMGVTGRAKKI